MESSNYNWMTIDSIHREMERFLDRYTGFKPPPVRFAKSAWEPTVDMYQTADELIIIVELAGTDEKDIQVFADNTRLIVRGKRNAPGALSRRSYYQKEIKSGFFERILTLPVAVDIQKTSATYLKGMLQITAPKSQGKLHLNNLIDHLTTIFDGRKTGNDS